MKRYWGVRPDETGTISRDALIAAMIDGATMLDIAGGVLEVVVGRAATDMPGEMVMTGAAFCWKDRTDATASPEKAVKVTPPEPKTEVEPESPLGEPVEVEAVTLERPDGSAVRLTPSEDNPDGFDYAKLEEEDVEDEPVGAR